jgi:predicted nucleic acid-binding protein
VKPVFLDTVGLIAIWDQDDQWHVPASVAFRRLKAIRAPVATTTFILAECGNAAARTAFRRDVDVLRQSLEIARGLIFPDEDDWRTAWNGYRRGESGQAGLVDQLSFAVMRRLGLLEAFTNDRHFPASGFVSLF